MQTRIAPWRQAFLRGTAALTAILTVFTIRPGYSEPGDIFTIPAPAIGADPPKAQDIKAGDATVSTQTGALEYSYPIAVPPGRNGMAPQLTLAYSSQAPTYGGIAAGWSLPIPMISEDRSYGRMENRSLELEQTQIDPKADDRFVSSMAGGRPLVVVDEPGGVESTVYKSYRAQGDTSWTRYERMNSSVGYRWRARTTDGIVHMFGNAARMPGCPVSDQFAPLTDSVDPFGNAVSYDYSWLAGECVLTKIRYGQSPSTNAFAQIDFIVKRSRTCQGIESGSQSDYRTGVKIVTGANQVDQINVRAIDPATSATVHTRRYVLSYDTSTDRCDQDHAPFRQLNSIQQSAWGIDSPQVDLPPITFGYNNATTTLNTVYWFGVNETALVDGYTG
ncbi:MAG: SpvB/TcaC N-terminal domain-containing protein [Kofleriaceae bacterium]